MRGKTALRAGFLANPAMKSKPTPIHQAQFLMPDLPTMLAARQPLDQLAQTIDWLQFEGIRPTDVLIDRPESSGSGFDV